MRAFVGALVACSGVVSVSASAAQITNIATSSGTLTFDTLSAGDNLTNNGAFSSATLGAYILDEGTSGSLQNFLLHFDRSGGTATTVSGTFDILLGAGESFLGYVTTRDQLLSSDPLNGVIYQTLPGIPTTYRGFEADDSLSALLSGSTVHVSYHFVNGTVKALDEARFGIATSAVPEPLAWWMMVAGFGLAGTVMRRNRARVSFTA